MKRDNNAMMKVKIIIMKSEKKRKTNVVKMSLREMGTKKW